MILVRLEHSHIKNYAGFGCTFEYDISPHLMPDIPYIQPEI